MQDGSTLTGDSVILLRILGNRGRYPEFEIATSRHLLVADSSIAWSAVRHDTPDDMYRDAEIAWLWPEEIRLYAAVSLVEPHPRSSGRYQLQPCCHAVRQQHLSWPVGHQVPKETKDQLWSQARELAKKARSHSYAMPFTDEPYERLTLGSPGAVRALIDAIDPTDPLLLRGLQKFLTANHLIALPPFLEEAGFAAFVSREAALLLLRRMVQERDGRRISMEQALNQIRNEFPTGVPFVEVLESDHEARNMIAHPANEFGVFWTPPVHAEECYDSIYSAVYLYRYLLLGEVWEPVEGD